jgi:hypothetical protein
MRRSQAKGIDGDDALTIGHGDKMARWCCLSGEKDNQNDFCGA